LHLQKTITVAAVTGMSVLMIMGNTKCGTGVSSTSSGGVATVVPVYAGGLGAAPTGGTIQLPGTWISSGGKTWIWSGATGAGIGVALAAAREAAKRGADSTYVLNKQIINHPCNGQKKNHKISHWPAKVVGHLTGQAKNSNPYLDCMGLFSLQKRSGIPARIKYVYDCIAKIIELGAGTTPEWGQAAWSYKGGFVVSIRGRISEVHPINGGWGACARA
jgi:hypothetical protein